MDDNDTSWHCLLSYSILVQIWWRSNLVEQLNWLTKERELTDSISSGTCFPLNHCGGEHYNYVATMIFTPL